MPILPRIDEEVIHRLIQNNRADHCPVSESGHHNFAYTFSQTFHYIWTDVREYVSVDPIDPNSYIFDADLLEMSRPNDDINIGDRYDFSLYCIDCGKTFPYNFA